MFALHGSPLDVARIEVTTMYDQRDQLMVCMKLKGEARLETRDELVEALPDYGEVVESILERAQDWEEKEYIDLRLKLHGKARRWRFHVEKDEEEHDIDIVGHVAGSPRLRVQPQKETTLKLDIEATVPAQKFLALMRLVGPGTVRVYVSDVQQDLFHEDA